MQQEFVARSISEALVVKKYNSNNPLDPTITFRAKFPAKNYHLWEARRLKFAAFPKTHKYPSADPCQKSCPINDGEDCGSTSHTTEWTNAEE